MKHGIICGDCVQVMKEFDDETIDLVVTSPPYFNTRPEYSEWDTYEDYQIFLNDFILASFRVLKTSGRIAINLPDGYDRNPWIPLYADACKLIQNAGFILRGGLSYGIKIAEQTRPHGVLGARHPIRVL